MKAKDRLKVCKKCSLARHNTMMGVDVTTCGELNLFEVPPIIGSVVQHEGKNVNLCGCVMEIKTKLRSATCPIQSWN